jgi:uncharacterized protein (TIGR03435 family)
MSAAAAHRFGRMYASNLLAMACVVMAASGAIAQGVSNVAATQEDSAPTQLPAFDVVSIKPHQDEGMTSMGIWFGTTPDGLSFKSGSLDMLLRFAFDVPRDRLRNEPEWAKSSRFDVEAKVAPEDAPRLQSLTRQQRWAMLIPALKDRCDLKFHHETRELQVYNLVVASGGVKPKETNPADSDAIKPGSTPREHGPPTPMAMSMSDRGMLVKGHGATMDSLAEMLSEQIGITVVNNTKLAGKYDFSLSWMPSEDSWQLMGLPIPGPPEGGEQSQQHIGPSIFAALVEQLGLKLEVRNGPVDVIVIDQIKQPSPN